MSTSASFIVTERCNLACTYCFENEARRCGRVGHDMSPKVVDKALDWLFEQAKNRGDKDIHVILFGGEPLYRADLCAEILGGGYKRQKETGIRFGVNLITNGTCMKDDIEYVLLKYSRVLNLTCQLSIDGNKEAHDLYRVTPSGHGSFDLIEKNVETFKEIFGGRLSVHGCVNKQTLPLLFDSYKYILDKWAIPNIWFMPVHTEDWSLDDVQIYDEQLGLIFEDMKKRNTVSIYAPINKCLAGIGNHPEKTCGAGNTFFSIAPNGDIYPCHNVYFRDPNKEQLCGNVFKGITNEVVLKPYRDYTIESLGCSDCDNVKCYRCIADNLYHNGDINKQVGKPNRCLMSSIELKYQKLAREYAEAHFVPNDLQEARVRQRILSELGELRKSVEQMKEAMTFLVMKSYQGELDEEVERRSSTDSNQVDNDDNREES